jgi:hypothetical protein
MPGHELTLDHLQLAIPADGEAACRAFWGGALGLTELPKPAALTGRGGVWFQAGALELHFGVDLAFIPAAKAHPGFVTSDITGLANRLKAGGHSVTWDDAIPGTTRFFTLDPFGNRLEFIGTTP